MNTYPASLGAGQDACVSDARFACDSLAPAAQCSASREQQTAHHSTQAHRTEGNEVVADVVVMTTYFSAFLLTSLSRTGLALGYVRPPRIGRQVSGNSDRCTGKARTCEMKAAGRKTTRTQANAGRDRHKITMPMLVFKDRHVACQQMHTSRCQQKSQGRHRSA